MRIAQISDLHLRHHLPGTASLAVRLSRLMPERFAQALERIRALSPDILVISGDLLDYPMDALDDPVTQQQGRQDLELIAELLDTLPLPVALVHGNHDHPALIDQVFGHLPNDQIVNGYRVLTFRDDEGENHVPVRTGQEQARFLAAYKTPPLCPKSISSTMSSGLNETRNIPIPMGQVRACARPSLARVQCALF